MDKNDKQQSKINLTLLLFIFVYISLGIGEFFFNYRSVEEDFIIEGKLRRKLLPLISAILKIYRDPKWFTN